VSLRCSRWMLLVQHGDGKPVHASRGRPGVYRWAYKHELLAPTVPLSYSAVITPKKLTVLA
jgi:hypothetical protein